MPIDARCCTVCGGTLEGGTVATGLLVMDTTGLPPGATFGPTSLVTGGLDGAAAPAAGPLTVGQAFGPRYHIIKLLGTGGMGAVYQAWDAELGVAVALKVIRVDLRRGSPSDLEKRFKNELLLARQVTHKNVVRIHDLGEIDGIKYITMPYLQGADLATELKIDGKLPIGRALRLTRQIVSGLEAAHEAGVVHRDLKPPNIMIDADDQAVIMDFGISVSTSDSGSGGVLGTLEYMAPEQAKGQVVDARADIYALGLILYEMLVGRRSTPSPQERVDAMKQRFEQGLPSVRTLDESVPAPLDALVARCLERDPAARFQTATELAAALDRLDDTGELLPIRRVVGMRAVLAGTLVGVLLLAGTGWYARTLIPHKQHDPVLVLIADFENTTSDPTFDHTLEPMVKLALEGAGFISAYDRNRVRSAFGVRPPDQLNEVGARELAVKQGVGVVLSGSIAARGNGYEISVKAIQALTGNMIAAVNRRASNKDQVLETATKLVSTVRKALGDSTSDAAQVLAMRSVSTTSLDVATQYGAALEAQYKGRYEEARQIYLKALQLDPKFGLGYQGLAIMSQNLGKLQDAEKYSSEALRYLDGMTERERLVTRGNYYRVRGDLAQCVKEFGDLIARYPADASAHNNRAVCLAHLRNMRAAVDEMRPAVQILPYRVSYRANLALFAAYAGDFTTAEREVRAIKEPTSRAMLALALSQLGQGLLQEATETYLKMQTIDALGASFSASGLGDVALYEGRFSDAVRIFEQGAAANLAAKNADSAAMKFASVAYAHLMRGQNGPAIAAAEKALQNSTAMQIRFLAGRILGEAGAVARARTVATSLASEVPEEPQSYGKIIQGEIALKTGDPGQAIKILTDANGVLDTWLGHFDLGRAYLELRAFPQADSEFDRCIRRRGEALSLLDEDPTYGYLPPVYYYQGRVREGLGTAGFADSYRAYLNIRGKSTEDPLLPEVRKRAGGNGAAR